MGPNPNEDKYWWAEQDTDEQWIAAQLQQHEQEQWEAEQDARRWAAMPEERELDATRLWGLPEQT